MPRIASAIVIAALAFSVASCSGDGGTPAATKTVTVSASPTDTPTAPAETSASATSSPAVPAPNGSDYQAVAIYAVQTETQSYRGASDSIVRELLQLVCSGLLVTDGKHVDAFGFEMGETALDSAGVRKNEYPIVMRAATAFCPNALEAVAAHYGTAG